MIEETTKIYRSGIKCILPKFVVYEKWLNWLRKKRVCMYNMFLWLLFIEIGANNHTSSPKSIIVRIRIKQIQLYIFKKKYLIWKYNENIGWCCRNKISFISMLRSWYSFKKCLHVIKQLSSVFSDSSFITVFGFMI